MHDIVLVSIMTGDTSVSKTPRLGLTEIRVAGVSRSSCELLQMMDLEDVSESQSNGTRLWIWK